MPKIFLDFFNSRKAQALLVLIVVVLLGAEAGLSASTIELTAEGICAFIIGRAIHDHGLAK